LILLSIFAGKIYVPSCSVVHSTKIWQGTIIHRKLH
jgi:hypothetical protein